MRGLRLLYLFASTVLLLATACEVDREADHFARSFIAHLRTGDSAGFALLEPRSEVSRAGWARIAAMARSLPQDSLESIHLLESDRGVDEQGAYTRLTYELRSATERALVELWLVNRDGRTFVNTVRIHPHATYVPLPHLDAAV